jgi:hypothetical protein
MNTIGDTTVFVGTTPDGVTVETRSLAIFLLRDPAEQPDHAHGDLQPRTQTRVQRLSRLLAGPREQRGEPELPARTRRRLAARHVERTRRARHRVHDDARVGGMLKNFVTTRRINAFVRRLFTGWARSAANRHFSLRSCATTPKTRRFDARGARDRTESAIAARSQRSRVFTRT